MGTLKAFFRVSSVDLKASQIIFDAVTAPFKLEVKTESWRSIGMAELNMMQSKFLVSNL